jgi:hypothetical protein
MMARVWLILLLVALAPWPQALANGESSSESSSSSPSSSEDSGGSEDAADEGRLDGAVAAPAPPALRWREAYRGAEALDGVEVIGGEEDAPAPPRPSAFYEAREKHRARARGQSADRPAARIEASLSAFDNAHDHLEKMPGFERLAVGDAEGRLAQHLVNIFVAFRQPGDGESAREHLQDFQHRIGGDDTTTLGKELEVMREYIEAREGNLGADADALTAAERRQFQSGIASIDAIKALIAIRQQERGGFFQRQEGIIADIKTALIGAGQDFFRNLSGEPRATDLDLNSLERLGGANAEVYRLHVDWDRREVRAEDNGRTNAVFKPDGVLQFADVAGNIGLVNEEATLRQGARQVMTYRLAQELGVGEMVPRTEAFNVADQRGVIQAEAEGGAAREPVRQAYLSQGQPQYDDFDRLLNRARAGDPAARKTVEESWIYRYRDGRIGVGRDFTRAEDADQLGPEFREAAKRPELWRNLATAEWFDLLCGQVDRNQGNFFVTREGGVQLIDNDQSFGHNSDPFVSIGTLPDRPAYIDKDLMDRLNALTPERVRQLSAGLLDTPEQDALVNRLEALQQHLNTVVANKGVIADLGTWRSQEVMTQLSGKEHHYAKADPGREAVPNGS